MRCSQAEKADPVKDLADFLRGKKGLDNRTAVRDGYRVEFFRAKDFQRHFRAHPEQMARLVEPAKLSTLLVDTANAISQLSSLRQSCVSALRPGGVTCINNRGNSLCCGTMSSSPAPTERAFTVCVCPSVCFHSHRRWSDGGQAN